MTLSQGMPSLRELYRIGHGPSSSHTMGPRRAAEQFRQTHPNATRYHVTLHGSLAATGQGHLTDLAIVAALAPHDVTFDWQPDAPLPGHPNGLSLEAFDAQSRRVGQWRGYSVGGGAIRHEDEPAHVSRPVYPMASMAELCQWATDHNQPLWALVEACEGKAIWDHLADIWQVMHDAVQRGLAAQGTLPGVLKLPRKARQYFALDDPAGPRRNLTGPSRRLYALALAVSEENAAGGRVATAPTCGACGVLPAVLHHFELDGGRERERLEALAIAGLIGNLVKVNASISGAEVGCQGEVGTACSMAAGAAAYLLGGSVQQIEYAAEMGLEHHLGLTCDPIAGLVQIPCIERNAMAAMRAVNCAEYALLGDGQHLVSFDEVVQVMRQTGYDLQASYRETAMGGLARVKLTLAAQPLPGQPLPRPDAAPPTRP